MKKRVISIGAILIGITIGFVIGLVIGVVINRGINVTSVRQEKAVAHNAVRTKVESHVVTVDKHFDDANVLHVSGQLNQVKTVKRSGLFDQVQVSDAGAAAYPGETPEFTRAGHNAG